MHNMEFLLELSKAVGFGPEKTIQTSSLAKNLDISQQSVSRKLKSLEEEGFIERRASNAGINVKIREKGRSILKSYYLDMKELFEKTGHGQKTVRGKVVSGLGEGRFYTEIPGYKEQFMDKLGIDPFPGTLNIKVSPHDRERLLRSRKKKMLHGFRTDDRTFGFIKGYPVKVNDMTAAVVVPERTFHDRDIIEVICGRNLRKTLGLSDGDEVKLE